MSNNNLKNKNILMVGVCIIGIILVIVLNSLEANITDLSLMQASQNSEGVYEPPTHITFIEKMGLLFLSSGLCYNFGVNEDVVELGFQAIFDADLDKMTQQQEDLFYTSIEDVANVMSEAKENDGIIDAEVIEGTSEETSEVEKPISDGVIKEEKDYSSIYEKTYHKMLDPDGNEIELDNIVRFTTPVGFSKENIDTTSNVWQINYRFYDGGLIGVQPSYWGSALFDEDEKYFDRAWTSLKWLCQDYLNCVVVHDGKETFEAIVYSSDDTYYWYLYLDKLYDYDAYGFGEKRNVLCMKVAPIKIEEAANIMYALGEAKEIE